MQTWQKIYSTTRWKKLRKQIYDRDNGICYFCHKLVLKKPNVHHLEEINETNALDESVFFNPENLVLCHHECHNAHHKRFGYKPSIVRDDLSIDYERRYK